MRFLYLVAIASSMIFSSATADLSVPEEWKDKKTFTGPVINDILNHHTDRAH